jgi:ABC-type antimicrobial peptide transport system permease subunit
VIVGLTGLTARSVTERTREMGVRLALGAVPFRLWLTATADSLVSVVTGIAFGILVALAGVRVMSGVLVGVSPPSTPLWAAAIALIGAMCAIAAGVAARRVMDIQPLLALRGE